MSNEKSEVIETRKMSLKILIEECRQRGKEYMARGDMDKALDCQCMQQQHEDDLRMLNRL